MLFDVREERLLVVSDIHLGSWFFTADQSLRRFLEFVADNGYNLCINGDGLDLLQTSLVKMTRELSMIFDYFGRLVQKDPRIYYVIGNHDIVLEHFIEDYRIVQVAPFLNVTSGDRRIRIEHGHLYDPFFVRHPDLYFFVTQFSGFLLKLHPGFFTWLWRALASIGAFAHRLWPKDDEDDLPPGIPGERSHFLRAAMGLSRRGFDAVVFGHTHHHGQVDLGEGKVYLNTGSWFHRPHYVKIENGDVTLVPWEG